MANLRNFKNNIREICGDLAADTLIAATIYGNQIDTARLNDILNELAALQEDTIALTKLSFDRSESAFENRGEYRKERRKYYKMAFAKLEKEFLDRAIEISKQIAGAIPAQK